MAKSLLLLLLLLGLQATRPHKPRKTNSDSNNPRQKEIPQYHCVIFARLLKQTTAATIKKRKRKAWQEDWWQVRFACEKEFDFAVHTSKAKQWHQPAVAGNSS